MKLLYITEKLPWGKGESFLYSEILQLILLGVDVKILPTFPNGELFHPQAHNVLDLLLETKPNAVKKSLATRLILRQIIRNIAGMSSKGPFVERAKKMVKNTALLKRASEAYPSLTGWKPDHIHVQWANYTATLGWVLSEAISTPWSFTAHRYDILYNNLLREKSESASFVRITSKEAFNAAVQRELVSKKSNCHVAYMGVKIPSIIGLNPHPSGTFAVAVPAALIERKGHDILIQALLHLPQNTRSKLSVYFYGDGPRKQYLEDQIVKHDLSRTVKVCGAIPHEDLLRRYSENTIDCVVLPSLNFGDGLGEGIPFSLMEAMAYRIPVITSSTGGSPELLANDSGILFEPGNVRQLADALFLMSHDEKRRLELKERGHERVVKNFSSEQTTKRLLHLIDTHTKKP